VTVLVQYEAEKIAWSPWNPEFGFYFDFESIGPVAFEIWLETETATPGVFDRELLSPQYYQVVFGDTGPIYSGGAAIIAPNTVPDTVTQLSIERNTPITQLCDFTNFSSFMMDMIEYTFDKQTMIIQELAYKKCNAGISDITQELTFDPQDVLYESMIDYANNRLINYMAQMVANGIDCTDNPGGT